MRAKHTRDRHAAWCVGVPALLFAVVLSHHPVLGVGHDATAERVAEGVSHIALRNAAFHAVVLLMLSVQAIGLWSFAVRLGLGRLSVRAGAFFYATATLLLFLAGTIDGFATPLLGHACSAQPTQCAGAITAFLWVEAAWIQALSKVGLGTQALALVCWSAALMVGPGGRRTALTGLAGILLALVPPLLLTEADLPIGPARLSLLVSFGCVWSLGAAVLLWTGGGHGRDFAAPRTEASQQRPED